MAYKVELNRAAGTSRLVYVATVHGPHGAQRRGHAKRRLAIRAGRVYHVTKGFRRDRDRDAA